MSAQLHYHTVALYLLNFVVGVVLGLFLYREYRAGFMVVIRDKVYSASWLVMGLVLAAVAFNSAQLVHGASISGELLLPLMILAGVLLPFAWVLVVTLLRFFVVDLVLRLLGLFIAPLAQLHTRWKAQMEQREIDGLSQHRQQMERILSAGRSRGRAVFTVQSRADRKNGDHSASSKGQARKDRESMPDLMSGFIDRLLDEKDGR